MSLKKYLQQFTKEQLIVQIVELNSKYKDVKTYYEFSINPGSTKAKDDAKKAIGKYICPDINYDLKLGEARKVITGFKKISPLEKDIADLMLFYVERGVIYTNAFGDINEPFYNSIAGMFYGVCEFIQKNNLESIFKQRCFKVVTDADGIGWGFHDEISDYYYEFFGTE